MNWLQAAMAFGTKLHLTEPILNVINIGLNSYLQVFIELGQEILKMFKAEGIDHITSGTAKNEDLMKLELVKVQNLMCIQV
jgi:hypothetical protein